jgi:hypothetical protein
MFRGAFKATDAIAERPDGVFATRKPGRPEAAMLRAAAPLLAFTLALALSAAGGAGTLGELHAESGLVDAKLGDSIESFTGLTLIGKDEAARTETYVRRSDTFRVGGAKVDGVTYSFYEGRLYFISVQMTGRENSESVFAELERTFGPGIKTGNRPNEHVWPGGKVFVLYDFDPETQRGMAAMTSASIQARMRLDRNTLLTPELPIGLPAPVDAAPNVTPLPSGSP